MNCVDFVRHVHLDCTPIKTRSGGMALFVPLNATFMDGEPLPMYVIPAGNMVLLTDGGDTLFHLHNAGFRILGERRRWASLREAVAPFGVTINDQGEIELLSQEKNLPENVSKFSAALMAASVWEAEHFRQPIDGTALIEEVREYLEATRPGAKIVENVEVKGISGRKYKFPLSLDGVLIDAMAKSGASSNSMVRRLVDIRAIPSEQETRIEIAVDDRDASEKSEQDIRLIELLATPLRVSRLQEEWKTQAVTH